MPNDLLEIDGSQGEGGGQLLRFAVSLSAATGRAIHITRIRAARPRPGMSEHHLAAVRTAAAVCDAEISGDAFGSNELTFRPAAVKDGAYHFDVPPNGSAMLVMQTVIPPLLLAGGDSRVVVTGGTHNPQAPCFHYVRDVFAVLAGAFGAELYFEMRHAGFAPTGAGEVCMEVRGTGCIDDLMPLRLASRGKLRYVEGLSAVSDDLPADVAKQQARQALARLATAGHTATMEQATWETAASGACVFLRAVFTRGVAGFCALGEPGKPAEAVADEAVDDLLEFLDGSAAVDAHAADQLLSLAALSPGETRYTTARLTPHLTTAAAIAHMMTGRRITIEADESGAGTVSVV